MSPDDPIEPFLPDAPRLPDPSRPPTPTPPTVPAEATELPPEVLDGPPDEDLPRLPDRPASVPRAAPEPVPSDEDGPAYGAMPTGSDEGRERARQIRVEANRLRDRRKRRNRIIGLVVLLVLGAGAAAAIVLLSGGEPEPIESTPSTTDDGQLTGALGAIDAAREVVPEVGSVRSFDGLLGATVLAHTDVLPPVDGYELYVVRSADLAAADQAALAALVEALLVLPQVSPDDPALETAPETSPGDIGIAVRRVDDAVIEVVAVSDDPVVRTVYP